MMDISAIGPKWF